MPIIVACPECGTRMRSTEELIGRDVKCARCATVFPAIEGGPDPAITNRPISSQDPPTATSKGTYGFQDPEPPSHARGKVEPPSRMWRTDDRDDDEDEDHRGRGRGRSGTDQPIVMSVVSIVLGIIAIPLICLCGPYAIAASGCAILTGGIGLKSENAKVLAIIGIVLGSIGIFLYLLALAFAFQFLASRVR